MLFAVIRQNTKMLILCKMITNRSKKNEKKYALFPTK